MPGNPQHIRIPCGLHVVDNVGICYGYMLWVTWYMLWTYIVDHLAYVVGNSIYMLCIYVVGNSKYMYSNIKRSIKYKVVTGYIYPRVLHKKNSTSKIKKICISMKLSNVG